MLKTFVELPLGSTETTDGHHKLLGIEWGQGFGYR
jgi:hypothetical protein